MADLVSVKAKIQAARDEAQSLVTPPPTTFLVGTVIYDAVGKRLHGLVSLQAKQVEIFLGTSAWGSVAPVNGTWSWPIPASATGDRTAMARAWYRNAAGQILMVCKPGELSPCKGDLDNKVTFNLGAVVTPPPTPAPTITNAIASPASLPAGGGSTTLSATIANATSVTVDGAAAVLPLTVNVSASKTFALVATGAGGTASASIAVTVAAVVQPPPPPPVGAAGIWARLPTAYNTNPALSTEAHYQSWYNLAYDSKRDRWYGINWLGDVHAFDAATEKWVLASVIPGANGIHNTTTVYDPLNDCLWVGVHTGAPAGVLKWDITTNVWSVHPGSTTGRWFGTEARVRFDAPRKRFIVFGGWNLLGVHTWSVDPPASSMVSVSSGIGPVYTDGSMNGAAKMTEWRTGYDSLRDRDVYVDHIDGGLWFLPTGTLLWQKQLTLGATKPHPFTQYVYDSVQDAMIGFCSSTAIAGGDQMTPIQKTWRCYLSGPNAFIWQDISAGTVLPPAVPYVSYAMAYDKLRSRVLLHISVMNFGPQTWVLPSSGA